MLQKKWSAEVKQTSIHRPGGSQRSSLACALYRQKTVVRAAVEALFEILAEKNGLSSILVQKTDWIADLLQKIDGLLKVVDCWTFVETHVLSS